MERKKRGGYSLAILSYSLYPDVERTMREIDLLHQITPHGVIPR